MQVCTHLSRFALVSRIFPGRNAKKYTGYCIIACVPMWLSTPILIEKCTQGKSSGAFLVFQGAFLKKRGAFFGESGAFLKAGCIFPRVECISEKQGAFWEDKVHCYYLFLKESQIESHL